ncbi:MAG: hypothetical protein ISR57_00495 [Bacteroidales bacterium]|nr:hypothetical protein [Bacteroidales bacterium]
MKNVKLVLTMMIALVFSAAIFAQETVSEEKRKVIKLKIGSDGDDEHFTLDTTIVIDENFDEEEFEAYMSNFKEKMKNLQFHMQGLDLHEDQLKDMEKSLQEMEVHLMGVEFDAQHLESLADVYEHFESPRHMEFYSDSDHPRSFRYNWTHDCRDKDIMKFTGKKGESLSDVLGDIPMSAVKSYKIRDTKYGKKIVIEVNDDFPMHHSEDVMIITRPRVPRIHVKKPKFHREIIIETDSDEDEEEEDTDENGDDN